MINDIILLVCKHHIMFMAMLDDVQIVRHRHLHASMMFAGHVGGMHASCCMIGMYVVITAIHAGRVYCSSVGNAYM